MTRHIRRSSVFATAAVLVIGACAGDADDQGAPADTSAQPPAAAPAPTTPAPAPAPGASGDLPEGVTSEMVAQGQAIFNQQICFSCHGMNGTGSPLGPQLNDQTWINTDGTYEGIIQVVRTGVQTPKQYTTPMPAMGGLSLTEDQIRAVAAYVYSISHGG